MKQIILATSNAHKIKEFKGLFAGCDFELSSAKVCGGMPQVVEDGDCFASNARIKAIALRAFAPNKAWILSDDSGLEVDALEGAPGIYSARYAGYGASDSKNVKKLLSELSDRAGGNRKAHFRCVLCLIDSEGNESYHEGVSRGVIASGSFGSGGFGYDPIFIPDGYSESFGQLGKEIKASCSHRALAVQAMLKFLEAS
ncbi:MAG: RdgB/HAM1 family non-canonical purine NTP pyrophosphatase [Verrucomicrobiota bacterium]|nr:RdgB/HAM1 family non-canonical purine NTP pyrophosphatase [Verrucomicrobiota bacterium]